VLAVPGRLLTRRLSQGKEGPTGPDGPTGLRGVSRGKRPLLAFIIALFDYTASHDILPRVDWLIKSRQVFIYDKYSTATKFTTRMDHTRNHQSLCVVNFVTNEYQSQKLVRMRFSALSCQIVSMDLIPEQAFDLKLWLAGAFDASLWLSGAVDTGEIFALAGSTWACQRMTFRCLSARFVFCGEPSFVQTEQHLA
jgi:hypothetical protein